MTLDIVGATRLVGPGMARTTLAQVSSRPSSRYKPPTLTRPSTKLRRKRSEKFTATRDADGQQPSDEVVYQESLALMRKLLEFTSTSTVEDLHAVTSAHTPAPPTVHVSDVEVAEAFCGRAAELVQAQLGPNLDKVGRTWWQWRKPGSETVHAQWVEMKVDYEERMARQDLGKKVIFYIHGGAYYLGGAGHDVQIQRHARK